MAWTPSTDIASWPNCAAPIEYRGYVVELEATDNAGITLGCDPI